MLSGKDVNYSTSQPNDITVNKEMPKTPEQMAAFQKEQQAQAEREKRIQEQRDIYNTRQKQQLEKEQEQEISGCVLFNGKYTAVDEYARPIHNKSHLCRQVIQDADRNVMKKPTRQTYQNTYSPEAEQQLETSREVEAQRQLFGEP